MTRVRMVLQYDGTNYVGWQTQPNGLAVQEVIERELVKLTGEAGIGVHASGRTDSGVHARAQVAHFDTKSRIPPGKFSYALNCGLPKDIRILYSDEAEGFHSRFDVLKKHYRYTVLNAPHASALTCDRALHIHYDLDVAAMQEAAAQIAGEHDFVAFKSAGVEQKTTVRTVYDSRWTKEGRYLHYDVSGSGFMYNMVRILAGTMIEIGLGRSDKNAVADALISGRRSDAGSTAPAHGLMLMRVEYKDFDTEEHIW